MMMRTKARPPSTPAMIATVLSSLVSSLGSSLGRTAVEGETEERWLWIQHTQDNSLVLGRCGILSLNTVTFYTGT